MGDRATSSLPAPSKTPTVVVVDGDRVSQRFAELALRGMVVETVKDAAGAFDVLKAQVVDLIVSETVLPDMNGLRFVRRLRDESRLRSVPFVFLSSDARAETKVLAFKAGVTDYLIKPCDPTELAARVHGIVARNERVRRDTWARRYTLAGDFSTMPFSDLVATLTMGHRTGVLSLLAGGVGGQVYFEDGRAVHARYGNLTGPEAFYHFVWEPEGQFEFSSEAVSLAPEDRSLFASTTALIMEAARLADTAARADPAPRASIPTGVLASVPKLAVPTRTAGPPPDATLAAQFEMAIRDPYALGDLKLLDDRSLASWTSRSMGRDRIHMLLIASLEEAISALLPLAGSLTERLVVDSLEPNRKALTLAFFLRNERLLDLTLLDVRDPGFFLPALRRSPSVVMLAPPGGDPIGFGTQGAALLGTVLDTLAPVAVMGIGLASLEDALARLGVRSREDRVVRCLPTKLGDPGADFRLLLVYALRLWTAGSKSKPGEPETGATHSGAHR